MSILIVLMWTVLVVVMVVLAAIILLQEGKGGGFAEAFGGIGAETFGVKASGVNRFTGLMGAVFIVLAIVINLLYASRTDVVLLKGQDQNPLNSLGAPAGAPEVPGDTGNGPGEDN